ncbi:MAG TPA: flagellar hook-associated protein FlgK [Pirellulaceae bacterium]|nr:flagellar hook-associated protein FlgK [Pirellulaceae bacterium]
MSLFGTIQNAGNALIAAQLGLQVTGNNIANANTPGYIRQRLILTPAPIQHYGGLLLGTGVRVLAVKQEIDKFLEERLRSANSDLANGETQEGVYLQLEGILGALTDSDLSTSLTKFMASINDVLNQPESASIRNLAVLQGQQLAGDIGRLNQQARTLYGDINTQIDEQVAEINKRLAEVADLNKKIVTAEGGDVSPSDAVGLRDRRNLVLSELSQIMDIRTAEQPAGDVAVYSGGDFLVFQGTYRPVYRDATVEDGLTTTEVRISETDAPVGTAGGKLAGLIAARDQIVGGFLNELDDFAATLIFEFNKLYSTGQGLIGFSSLTSEFAADDPAAPLNQAGLDFAPVNGLFQVQVKNSLTGLTETTDVFIDLDGLSGDTSLDDLVAALDAIDGISASLDSRGRLEINADAPNMTFSFAGDTSGTLAALGLNHFFSGTGAHDIGISQVLRAEPRLFAASLGGPAEDARNAERLADFLNRPLATQDGLTLGQVYDQMASDITQGAAATRAATEGFRTFQQTLEGQALSITGVNLDEEAVKMITWQRSYQASAKIITTVNEMLETLLNM